ncbi:Superoxide dismutase [Cu-Zn] precursor [Methanosarcina siciliae T4/M]|uniref:Superoxide dismutase [Cu-Zn] n=2 Tax=Methanosarcina siciliae TaxID=38027 RepID=A0A0E3PDC8_9EURY|nr:superoxide dismutase family protein [Methanosarcina siciliae]AKB28179.1 Superoxide dismutase [Cu-Zn] precursor [Methanosarcina siciliae T4/M]AKB32098.1 Superoxide dismutase [Cu-Zn] precursor [Methanosarcina siciliae HI350]
MKTGLILLMIISTVLMFATVGSAQDNSTDSAATVIKDANGSTVGFATFTEDDFGMVRVQVFASNLTPGLHGIHIHEKANCTGPSFTSAGGHYNPLGKEHGLYNPKGPHAGDLPNLLVGQDGTGYMDVTTNLVTLSSGNTTLFPANGTSLVIHADPDDQLTNPSGNSGARIACGAIEKR